MHSFGKTTEPRSPHATTGPVVSAKSLPSTTVSAINIQAKLEVTEPGDSYETEADTMAELALSRVSSSVNSSSSASSLTSSLAPASMISRVPSGHSSITVRPDVESAIISSRGGGFAMPASLRNQMESGFGADFSDIRLHTGQEAASLSSSIQAKAFTSGKDIYFNEGQFNPDTTDGQKIIAHELAHTMQQSGMVARTSATDDGVQDDSDQKLSANSIKKYKQEVYDLIGAGFNSYEIVQMLDYAINNPNTSTQEDATLPFLNTDTKSAYGSLYIIGIKKKVRRGVDVETLRSNKMRFIRYYFPFDKKECDQRIKKETADLLANGFEPAIILKNAEGYVESKSAMGKGFAGLKYAIDYARSTVLSDKDVLDSLRTEIEYRFSVRIFAKDSSLTQAAEAYKKLQDAKDDGGLVYQASRFIVDIFNQDELKEINTAGQGMRLLSEALRKDYNGNDDSLLTFNNEFLRIFGIPYNAQNVIEAEDAFKEYSVKLAAVNYHKWADKQLRSCRSDAQEVLKQIRISSDKFEARQLTYFDLETETRKNILNRVKTIFNADLGTFFGTKGCNIDDIPTNILETIAVPSLLKYLKDQKDSACEGKDLDSLEKVYRDKSKKAYGSVLSDAVTNAKTIMIATQITELGLNVGVGVALGACGGGLAGLGAKALQLGATGSKVATVAANATLSLAFDLIVDPSARKTKLSGTDYGFAILSAVLGSVIDWTTFKAAKSFTKAELRTAAKGADDAADAVKHLDEGYSEFISQEKNAYSSKIAQDKQIRSDIDNIQSYTSTVDSDISRAAGQLRDINGNFEANMKTAEKLSSERTANANTNAKNQYDALGNKNDTVYVDKNQSDEILAKFKKDSARIEAEKNAEINAAQNGLDADSAEAMARRIQDTNRVFAKLLKKTGINLPDAKLFIFDKNSIENASAVLASFKVAFDSSSHDAIKSLKNKLPKGDKELWKRQMNVANGNMREVYLSKRSQLSKTAKDTAAKYSAMFPEQYGTINALLGAYKTMAVYFAKMPGASPDQQEWLVDAFKKSLDITSDSLGFSELLESLTVMDNDELFTCIIYDTL